MPQQIFMFSTSTHLNFFTYFVSPCNNNNNNQDNNSNDNNQDKDKTCAITSL